MRFTNLLLVLAISLLVCGASAQWTKLADISPLSFDYGTFTDSSGNIHLAYCKRVSGTNAGLFYAKMLSDGKLEPERLVYQGADCRSATITANSKGDGKIYIAFSEAKLCGVGAYACASVLFTESLNNGVEWSKPIVVHETAATPMFRYNPLILLNEDTGRVWVAFKARGKEDPSNVVAVSRAPGSTIFSREILVAKLARTSMVPGGFAAMITKDKANVVLHLAYLDRDFSTDYLHGIYYTKSNDNGNTWSAGVSVGQTDLRDSASPFAVTEAAGTLFVEFSRTDAGKNGVWMGQSKDEGKTWVVKQISMLGQEDKHLATAAQTCNIGGKNRVYTLLQDELMKKAKNAFGFLDIETEIRYWLGNPYGTDVDECYIPKVVCGSGKAINICKLSKNKENDVLVYKSTQQQ